MLNQYFFSTDSVLMLSDKSFSFNMLTGEKYLRLMYPDSDAQKNQVIVPVTAVETKLRGFSQLVNGNVLQIPIQTLIEVYTDTLPVDQQATHDSDDHMGITLVFDCLALFKNNIIDATDELGLSVAVNVDTNLISFPIPGSDKSFIAGNILIKCNEDNMLTESQFNIIISRVCYTLNSSEYKTIFTKSQMLLQETN